MKKALMLIRQDAEIQRLADGLEEWREKATKELQELDKARQLVMRGFHEAEEAARQAVEDRLKSLGVEILEKEKHRVSFDAKEGVVWLETAGTCACGKCGSLQGVLDQLFGLT